MASQENYQETVNAPYLIYYVNAIIENETIVKEQTEYIEKLKRKLELMKKLKEINEVYELLNTIKSIEQIIDKNTSIICSTKK